MSKRLDRPYSSDMRSRSGQDLEQRLGLLQNKQEGSKRSGQDQEARPLVRRRLKEIYQVKLAV